MGLVFSVRPSPLTADLGLLAARIALAWIFIYYGAGKLFGAFNGPGIHRTTLYFSTPRTFIRAGSSPSSGV